MSKLKPATFDGEEKPFFMPDDGSVGRREQYGVRKSLRMWRNGEAYGFLDPDELASLAEPPPHAQAALEDVLGEWAKDHDGGDRIKLRVHPHMRRWALYEREYRPELGGQYLWRCFYIFQTDPAPGYLPADLDGDLYTAHFRGKVGDYVEPDRSHFELIERFNRHKYGVDQVNKVAGELEDAHQKWVDAREEERTAAFLDENWMLAWDEANQAAGSGHYMRSSHCAGWSYKSNLSRWRREEKNGYSIITKKSREEYEAELRAEVERFAEAWGEARGLRRNFKPTEAEWDEIFSKSGLDPSKPPTENKRILMEDLDADMRRELIENAPDEEEKRERLTALRSIRATKYPAK